MTFNNFLTQFVLPYDVLYITCGIIKIYQLCQVN